MEAEEVETRVAEVRACLAEVCDPELDESVTDLGFVDEILIHDGGEVEVTFHLPTFWCAANFAYMMATDMRSALTRLPWVTRARIELKEHFCSNEISSGVEGQRSFKEIFAEEANADVDEVRLLFQRKSFQRRQELLLRALLERGYQAVVLLSLSLADLLQVSLDEPSKMLRSRYLNARKTLKFPEHFSALAFHTVEGEPLDASRLEAYLVDLRRIRLNTEFNAVLCRGLLEARYGTKQPDGLVMIQTAHVLQPPVRTYPGK